MFTKKRTAKKRSRSEPCNENEMPKKKINKLNENGVKMGICRLTQENDIILETKCCKQTIGEKAFYKIILQENGCCPYCKNTSIRIDLNEQKKIIAHATNLAKSEYYNLPHVQACIMLRNLKIMFSSKENMKKLIDNIYSRLQFNDDYYHYINSLFLKNVKYVINYGAEKKIEEFFQNFIDQRLQYVLKVMERKITARLVKDERVVVNIILNRVRKICEIAMKQYLIKEFKKELVDMLVKPITKHLNEVIEKSNLLADTLLRD